MRALYFDNCFGVLHPADSGRGVVLCSALGAEELITHRLCRRLACELAASGSPVLRLDYHGTGNSLGNDSDPERLAAWLDSIVQAEQRLRLETGVTEVALIGFRFGGLLATLAAERLKHVKKLALIGTVTSCRTFIRESRALVGFGSAQMTPDRSGLGPLEVAGFTLSEATQRELENINLSSLEHRPAAEIFILGKASAVEVRLAAQLRRLGSKVTVQKMHGYAELEWNSTFAKLPADAFTELVGWIRDGAPPAKPARPDLSAPILRAQNWTEKPIRFGAEQRLFAIYCNPGSTTAKQVVVLLNHGANHHIGWARMHVTLARRLADKGIASLRMDAAGIGESNNHPSQTDNKMYAVEAQNDARAALDWLVAQGHEKCILAGNCAGAYSAFHTSVADERVAGLVMVNLQCFFWNEGDSLEVSIKSGFRSTGWYLAMIHNRDAWRRILMGRVNVRGIARKIAERIIRRWRMMITSVVGPLFDHSNEGRQVLDWFRKLDKRGAKVLLVYSDDDGGLDELAAYAGTNGRSLSKLTNIKVRIINGADHNLTPKWSRERYFEILEDHLDLTGS